MTSKIGSNSQPTKDRIKDFVAAYVACDEKSAEINDERAGIRERVKDLGLDTKAFQDAVSRAKKDRSKKEGYDESMQIIVEALGEMDQDDLFSFIDERREEKERLREEKKAKADEFKPAAERAPKNGKSVKPDGVAQADAYLAANG